MVETETLSTEGRAQKTEGKLLQSTGDLPRVPHSGRAEVSSSVQLGKLDRHSAKLTENTGRPNPRLETCWGCGSTVGYKPAMRTALSSVTNTTNKPTTRDDKMTERKHGGKL